MRGTSAFERRLVLSPLIIESWALGRLRGARVERIGMGPERARAAAARFAGDVAEEVYVVGFGGALDTGLDAGEVVVADRVLGPDGGDVPCDYEGTAKALHDGGVPVTVATLASSEHIVTGEERATLASRGARVVDMESYWLGPLAVDRSLSAIRVIVDGPTRELSSPLKTMVGGVRALRTLRRIAEVLFAEAEN